MQTDFAGIKLENPTVLASGILGTSAEILIRAVKEGGAGAATIKSIGPVEKDGYANPTILEWEHGLINAVGLPSPGYENIEQELAELEKSGIPLIASVYAHDIEEYAKIAAFAAKYKPAMIELNMSCPHSKGEGMPFGIKEDIAGDVVRAVKGAARQIPVMPKLTPQALNIASIASACEKAGADAICAINTLGPGMVINIEARKPMLANKFGGISGPAIKPIALRCVYQIYEAVKIPVLGMGGISNGRDAIEFIQAGATAVGIGSAVHYHGVGVFGKVCREMEQWMEINNIKDIKEIRGVAHG
ncbi:MAG: dihydroorotate dehydrogenase [Candidatus Diapherotrites archaeon]|uniref:Dihydroorotate dehydrogenase n=1 Tax=Candidatus Iainarchaeum sp. TaxID=3101447 RepID=A0A938YN68_9ARCH|nr:dihydroorotate dehydrogenase [Candidatus Diapherotrites archaeon]